MITKEQFLEKVQLCPEQGYALYVSHKGQVLEAYNGVRELGKPELIDCNSNFRMASVSKQFIGHAIRTLVDKGLLTYETTLQQIFGGMPAYCADLTIMQLLNHTTGLHEYEDMPMHRDRQLLDPDVLEFVRGEKECYFPAGTDYKYSNTGYVLLGLIIEKLSGQCIEDYVKENVLLPFGMTNSCVNRQGQTQIKNRVYGTALKDGKLVQQDQGHSSATIGDGGVYSNIKDLITYLDKFVTLDLENLYQPRKQVEENLWYSRGIRILKSGDRTIWVHTGGTCGTHTLLGSCPAEDLKFAFMTNMDAVDCSDALDAIKTYLKW